MSKEQKPLPKLGDMIFVWPAMRTVRDDTQKPVLDDDGKRQKKPAYVRNAQGVLITKRTFVKVDLHYFRLISGHNLDWCTREENRKHVLEKTKAHAAQQAAAQSDAAPKAPVKKMRGDKSTQPEAADTTAKS